jgi:hypothetical protein
MCPGSLDGILVLRESLQYRYVLVDASMVEKIVGIPVWLGLHID